jgi:aminoglycoside phosphotransferase (APT) family kinase protein
MRKLRRQRRRQATELARLLVALDKVSAAGRPAYGRRATRLSLGRF